MQKCSREVGGWQLSQEWCVEPGDIPGVCLSCTTKLTVVWGEENQISESVWPLTGCVISVSPP